MRPKSHFTYRVYIVNIDKIVMYQILPLWIKGLLTGVSICTRFLGFSRISAQISMKRC